MECAHTYLDNEPLMQMEAKPNSELLGAWFSRLPIKPFLGKHVQYLNGNQCNLDQKSWNL